MARTIPNATSNGIQPQVEVEDFAAIQEILKPYDPTLMRHYPVSPRVNSVQNDDAECATPITLDLPEQARLF